MRRRNPNAGFVVFWVKLKQRGYICSITDIYRALKRTKQVSVKPQNPKYIPKPYEQMQYPGQRGQIDVKFVSKIDNHLNKLYELKGYIGLGICEPSYEY